MSFDVIPSLDLLGGSVVRLTRGDFSTPRVYGDAEEILDRLQVPAGSRLHVVDLEGSRDGRPVATAIVRGLARRDLRIQVGGGVRSENDVRTWLEAGAAKIVVGTIAAEDPALMRRIVDIAGAERIIPAIDVLDGSVRVNGWTRTSATPLREVLARVEDLGMSETLVTDISRDGVMAGPSFGLYREIGTMSRVRVIASGGVSGAADVESLARLRNVSGCVIGKALLDDRLTLAQARDRSAAPDAIPARVIPCLDIRDGRVVKGVNFEGIRDAGDPVESAMRYEAAGADEITVLDISASDRGVASALETIRGIADSIFIPLTVGGGVRTVEDFRAMLRAGADRVAINTAAVRRPELIAEAATEFGVQAVVLSCDAKRDNGRFDVMVRGGRESAGIDAIEWCRRAESLGAGEILLTSVDRDGTHSGFDVDLLRAATGSLTVGVIASGGAGALEHFSEAVERGGARAVLAASLFHDRRLTVGEVKAHMAGEGIPVR